MELSHIIPLLMSWIVLTVAVVDEEEMKKEAVDGIFTSMESFLSKSTLKYKEKCDYAQEKELQKLLKAMQSFADAKYLGKTEAEKEQHALKMLDVFKNIGKLKGPFCSSTEHLQCNEKGLCDCAKSYDSLGLNLSFKRDGDACLFSRGSMCLPVEFIQHSKQKNPFHDHFAFEEMKCADEVPCIIKRTRQECTMEATTIEFKRLAAEEHAKTGQTSNPFQFIMRKANEGVCVCKGTAVMASILLVSFMVIVITGKHYIE